MTTLTKKQIANCEDCVHDGVCYLQEICNDIKQQLNDFGCDDFKPTADVVPMGAYKQILWERNMAMRQLQEYGIPLCGEADVVAIRHGTWLDVPYPNNPNWKPRKKCSVCGRVVRRKTEKYCPDCGAKMDGKKYEK